MLFSVSFEDIEEHYPRIPKNRIEGEDSTQKRICFTTDVKRGITAMPNGILSMRNLLNFWWESNIPPIFYIYSIDEKTIDKKNIVSTRTLARKKLVPDANIGKEVWVINQNVKCKKEIVILKSVSTFIRRYKSINRQMLVVKDLEFERTSEPYERSFPFKFRTEEQCNEAKKIAINLGCNIVKVKEKRIKMKVPANIDIALLLEKIRNDKWNWIKEGYTNDTGLSAPSISTILGTNF